jgi:uncharacterized protein (TIGR03000 family)
MRSFLFIALVGVSAPSLRAEELALAMAERRPATVRVTLPLDARLTIDGRATRSTGVQRLFVTPPLDAGQSYSYTLTASFPQAGKTVTVEQEVLVRAGRETLVSLDLSAGASGGDSPRGDTTSSYRPAQETRAFYYAPPDPPALPRAGLSRAPFPAGEDPGPRAGRSDSSGFNPVHWGTDQSDPFYHSQP